MGTRRSIAGLAAMSVLLLLAPPVSGDVLAKPSRVVSLFLCTDDLVIRLADRDNISSVSYWSADRSISNVAARARGLHHNHGLAEEILPLEPDLVLSGQFTARAATGLLRRLGYRVEVIPVAADFGDIRRNIRRVAALLGEGARGEAMIRRFDTRIATATRNLPGGPRPVAAYYWTGGYSAGDGTLADAVLSAAGFENYAHRAALGPSGRFPLERVVAAPVDALVLSAWEGTAPSMSRNLLRHPALLAMARRVPSTTLPRRLLACGTPAVAEAVERLSALRRLMAE